MKRSSTTLPLPRRPEDGGGVEGRSGLRYVNEHTDPRYVEYWDRLTEGLRKAGLRRSERRRIGGRIGKSDLDTLYGRLPGRSLRFPPDLRHFAEHGPPLAVVRPASRFSTACQDRNWSPVTRIGFARLADPCRANPTPMSKP